MLSSVDYVSFNAGDVTSAGRTARGGIGTLLVDQAKQLGAQDDKVERPA